MGSRTPKHVTQVTAPTTTGGLGCRLSDLLHHPTVPESVICNGYPRKVSGNENEGFPRILASPDTCSVRKSSPLLSKPFPKLLPQAPSTRSQTQNSAATRLQTPFLEDQQTRQYPTPLSRSGRGMRRSWHSCRPLSLSCYRTTTSLQERAS